MEKNNPSNSVVTEQLQQGYTLWLESTASHAHVNDQTKLALKWGRPMQAAGTIPGDEITAVVIRPDGQREEMAGLAFTPTEEGFYTVVCRYQHSAAEKSCSCSQGSCASGAKTIQHIQRALTIVTVGHHIAGEPRFEQQGLEIQPLHWQHWHAGAALELELLFRKQPLSQADVELIIQGPQDSCQQIRTSAQGKITIAAAHPGRYLLMARHTDSAADVPTIYTTTFAFMVTKHHHHH